MKAYFTRAPLQSTPRPFFQDVSLLLNTAELGAKLQDLLLRIEQLIGSLLFLARPNGLHPLVQAVARDAETIGDLLHRMATLRDLLDGLVFEFRRVALLTHVVPPASSILTSEVSMIPGEVHIEAPPFGGRAVSLSNPEGPGAP
jgi:hypothetical protein